MRKCMIHAAQSNVCKVFGRQREITAMIAISKAACGDGKSKDVSQLETEWGSEGRRRTGPAYKYSVKNQLWAAGVLGERQWQ